MVALWIVWGLVIILFFVLVLYRSRISRKETDWISLSEDAKEEKAIQEQKVTEMKSQKFDLPIRIFGALSVIMLLVIFGVWLYHGLTAPQ